MQDLIDDQEPLFSISASGNRAAEEDLAEYSFAAVPLKVTWKTLTLNDAEIQAFLSGIRTRRIFFQALAANTSAFESLRKIADRNRDDLDVQVRSQARLRS